MTTDQTEVTCLFEREPT